MKLTEMSKEKKPPKPATNPVFNQNNELYGSATGLAPILSKIFIWLKYHLKGNKIRVIKRFKNKYVLSVM